ncbi:MAG TPA: hypothetical protein VM660_03610, partial [Bacillus sp. (in: firmicutes)]|nr:hypothetical protein [Bacillus sp. (in: firmicutes)]
CPEYNVLSDLDSANFPSLNSSFDREFVILKLDYFPAIQLDEYKKIILIYHTNGLTLHDIYH